MTRAVLLDSYPDGAPTPGNFILADLARPEPCEGEVLVAVSHLSMDPFPRLRMRAASPVGPALPLGQVVEGRGVGQVLASRHPGFREGDLVSGDFGWRSEAAIDGAHLAKLNPALGAPPRHLSLLGPSGMTAYFSMAVLGHPKAGETVVVAPAAGSVGAIAGQIARRAGARVVGVVSGQAQADFVTERLGFAGAIDHRDRDALAQAAPAGVDLFLDGVGGALHDEVMTRLNARARVVMLGFISGYNDAGPPHYGGAAPILFKRARVEGFLLADWVDRFSEALDALSGWERAGSIDAVETIWPGLDKAPEAFCALFGEAPVGKQIVAVQA